MLVSSVFCAHMVFGGSAHFGYYLLTDIRTMSINKDRSPEERIRAMRDFNEGKTKVHFNCGPVDSLKFIQNPSISLTTLLSFEYETGLSCTPSKNKSF
jgi:hypothetical protein